MHSGYRVKREKENNIFSVLGLKTLNNTFRQWSDGPNTGFATGALRI